jgi:TetR/AcrR family acrAB operon transcriptional repressor
VTDKPTPEARRQAILAAAISVFAVHGFDAATTDEIARAAGLSKGGLYWHFKSKDDILAALLEQFFNQELAVLEQPAQAGGSVGARLRQLGEQAVDAILQMEPVLPVVLEFYALAARQAQARAQIQGYYQRYQRRLADLLQQGYDTGEFRAGTAEQYALLLIAQLEGLALMWAIAPQVVSSREQVSLAIEVLLRGLSTP